MAIDRTKNKTVNFIVPADLHKRFKLITMERGQTIKGALIGLMRKEVEAYDKHKKD